MAARLGVPAVLVLLAGCADDRVRPLPVEQGGPAQLSVQVLAPRHGLTVPLGRDLVVSVSARDQDGRALTGVGFVARRFVPGAPTLDSVVVTFPARADTSHHFVLHVPADLPTNAQIDIYGLAFGRSAPPRVSAPASVVGVPCTVSC